MLLVQFLMAAATEPETVTNWGQTMLRFALFAIVFGFVVAGFLNWALKRRDAGLSAQIAEVLRRLENLESKKVIPLGVKVVDVSHKLSSVIESLNMAEQKQRVQWANEREFGIYEVDKEGKWIWVNPTLAHWFGMESADLMGHGWLAAIDVKERTMIWEQWQDALENRTPFAPEYGVVNPRTKEHFRACLEVLTPLRSGDEVLGYVGRMRKCEKTNGRKTAE